MTTLTWNGTDLPQELRELPPGEYVITGTAGPWALTPAEEAGLQLAVAQAQRGEVVPHDDVEAAMRALLRGRAPSR